LRLKALPTASARVEWTDGGTIKADVDPLSTGHLAGVLHELMHIVLQDELKPFAEYGMGGKREPAELALEAWEAALAREILSSPRRKSWWRKAIRGKLPR
jgi:hypothetical protein